LNYKYLSNSPCEQAVKDFISALKSVGTTYKTEVTPTRQSNGLVAASAQYARRCSPHYCACAMDGIALKSSITSGASESSPVTIKAHDYVFVDTGDPLPQGCDCVVMIEDVVEHTRGAVRLYAAATPWSNVRQVGEDICMGDMIIPSFTVITPSIVGALLAAGVYELETVKKPTAAIIPTGDEIINEVSKPKPGEIPEFNSAIFSAMLDEWGVFSKIYPTVPDKPKLLLSAVSKAARECDAVIVIAGSSAGRDDYTSSVLEKIGKLVVHGVAIKPGKPVVLGHIGSVPFFGIPGYPVSGIIVMEEIVRHVMRLLTKRRAAPDFQVKSLLTRKITSSLKYKEFIRCGAASVDKKLVAVPMRRGAGIVSGFAKAGGIITVSQNSEGIGAGSEVMMKLLKNYDEIKNSVCVTGSHDPLIDEVSDILMRSDNPMGVVSSHVGSMGAVMALRNGEAHMGGIHLLDTETGEYNTSYAKRYFPDGGVALIRGVVRRQGLIVARGNPLDLNEIKDIARTDISYINRQKGSGTRILLDYLLDENGMNPCDVRGYEREEYTHTAVAAAISSGNADAGLGIFAASKIYSLDFIPLWNESYDFLVLSSALEDKRVKRFIKALQSENLRKRLDSLGGYLCEQPGEIVFL
jgi:putative molybdopterin biosynthesis protein